jgi:hypothetical protein
MPGKHVVLCKTRCVVYTRSRTRFSTHGRPADVPPTHNSHLRVFLRCFLPSAGDSVERCQGVSVLRVLHRRVRDHSVQLRPHRRHLRGSRAAAGTYSPKSGRYVTGDMTHGADTGGGTEVYVCLYFPHICTQGCCHCGCTWWVYRGLRVCTAETYESISVYVEVCTRGLNIIGEREKQPV